MDAAQRQLITDLVPFSALVVKDFLHSAPQFRSIGQDLRQAAALILVTLSYRYADFDGLDHFRNYLRRSIRNGCWSAVRLENVIQSPRIHNAQRRPFFDHGDNRRAADVLGSHFVPCEVGIPATDHDDVEAPAEILHEGEFHELTSAQAMEAACNDDSDKQIFSLSQKGVSMSDIARKIGIPRKAVKRRALNILGRFRELY